MAAPKGNQFWKLRSKHGRDAIFTDPQVLLDACYEYFEATSKRKWKKKEAIKSGDKAGTSFDLETETPFSLSGLCVFLGVNTVYFNEFENSKTYAGNKDFSKVYTHVREIIDTQQFEGAVVGCFNASIIARKLGLSETIEQNTKIETNPELSELFKKYLQILGERNKHIKGSS